MSLADALRQYVQGATFGFGDEAVSALSALGALPFTNQNYADLYNSQLDFERGRNRQFEQKNPISSLVLQGAGGIGTGGKLGSLLAGLKPVSSFIAANPIKSTGLAAALSGGLYGYGIGEGLEDRTTKAGLGAAISAPFSMGGHLAYRAIPESVKQKTSSAFNNFIQDEAGNFEWRPQGRGYNYDLGKSNNAILAEKQGIFPLRTAASVISKNLGIKHKDVMDFLKKQKPTEWHHTGKSYKETNYYDTEEFGKKIKASFLLKDPKIKNALDEYDNALKAIKETDFQKRREAIKSIQDIYVKKSGLSEDDFFEAYYYE